MNPENNMNPVDKILGAMRDAEPSAGMEARILQTLDTRSRDGYREHEQRPSLLARLRWVPVAALAVLAVAVVVNRSAHRDDQTSATTTHRSAAATPRSGSVIAPQTTAALPAAVSAPRRRMPAVKADAAQVQAAAEQMKDASVAVSHPAPPIPVTAQERLLLRYARGGHTDDLAQISNERRAAEDEQEKTAFQAFFKPPPPIKIGE
ncbi:MAG: hypothetical protein PW789_19005 [Edaphobacter sp.]|uniref:hypothetical protein n=1 Tax=Edaphobacter sp. TaxID=1934404 RepID=UPI0023A03565|nr:hypothetical protein [Edaphobacter sp.]MDE1178669.1 hypothetical protein [Edaphobacter sp.]